MELYTLGVVGVMLMQVGDYKNARSALCVACHLSKELPQAELLNKWLFRTQNGM